MSKAFLGTILLLLAACAPAEATEIDPSDNLHCAVVLQTLEMNADQLGASPTASKGLYVLQTWFFAKVDQKRLGEAEGVIKALKANPTKLAPTGQVCSTRAFSDAGFSRWRSVALADYDQQARGK